MGDEGRLGALAAKHQRSSAHRRGHAPNGYREPLVRPDDRGHVERRESQSRRQSGRPAGIIADRHGHQRHAPPRGKVGSLPPGSPTADRPVAHHDHRGQPSGLTALDHRCHGIAQPAGVRRRRRRRELPQVSGGNLGRVLAQPPHMFGSRMDFDRPFAGQSVEDARTGASRQRGREKRAKTRRRCLDGRRTIHGGHAG